MLHSMWDLSSQTRNQSLALVLAAWSLSEWTVREFPTPRHLMTIGHKISGDTNT